MSVEQNPATGDDNTKKERSERHRSDGSGMREGRIATAARHTACGGACGNGDHAHSGCGLRESSRICICWVRLESCEVRRLPGDPNWDHFEYKEAETGRRSHDNGT